MLMTRRAMLAAAGTLAAALELCKPGQPRADELASLADLSLNAPPKKLPGLHWSTADGRLQTLADYAGKGVILNLWATWCMPCVQEMPSLDRLSEKLSGQNVAVLPLSSDHGGASAVRAFYASHGIRDLPVLLDTDGAVERALGVRGIPTTLLIDRQGRERGRVEGAADWTSAEAMTKIDRLVG
ncbi:MAG TPA: TlpA disulfide reductase family protein [Acetobacteraceae bacterium]|nr:TlpA disulfide reductase family protein [Acetobacteraceae bacterium]